MLEPLIQPLPEIRLYTQRLQHEDAHLHYSLFGGVCHVFHGIELGEDYKIMGSVGVDNKGAEPLVALECFPEEHHHLRGPLQ